MVTKQTSVILPPRGQAVFRRTKGAGARAACSKSRFGALRQNESATSSASKPPSASSERVAHASDKPFFLRFSFGYERKANQLKVISILGIVLEFFYGTPYCEKCSTAKNHVIQGFLPTMLRSHHQAPHNKVFANYRTQNVFIT